MVIPQRASHAHSRMPCCFAIQHTGHHHLFIHRSSVAYIHSQVAGVFTNLFGGVAGSKFGLKCTLLSSLVLQASKMSGKRSQIWSDKRGAY